MMRPILLGLVTLVANGASEVLNGEVRAASVLIMFVWTGSSSLVA